MKGIILNTLVYYDWELKRKNHCGWVFYGPVATNFVHSFMIAETLDFAEILLRSMQDILIILMDKKCEEEGFWESIPGNFLLLFYS